MTVIVKVKDTSIFLSVTVFVISTSLGFTTQNRDQLEMVRKKSTMKVIMSCNPCKF